MDQVHNDKLIKKFPIGALQAGCNTALIVAVIINKSEPRRVVSKTGEERWVTTITLRDSPLDMINLTVWCGAEEAVSLKNNYHIGEVVEVVKPRILQRDPNSRESAYVPDVTSCLQLVFVDGKSMIAPYLGDCSSYQHLLRIPSKASSAFLSVSDILTNSGSLKGHFVDILAAVRSVGAERKVGSERSTREVKLFDQTGDCLVLKLWDSELISLSSDWMPRDHILFLSDVRVDFDSWKRSFVVTFTSKSVVTVNPETKETESLQRYAASVDFSTVSRLEQFSSSLDLDHISRIVNIESLNHMLTQTHTSSSSDDLMAVKVFGYITRFDVDCPEAISYTCGSCSGPLRRDGGSREVCLNLECSEYNSVVDVSAPVKNFNTRADITDETGTLTNIKLFAPVLEKRLGLGTAAEFPMLSEQTKTFYKWQVMMKPMKITVAALLTNSMYQRYHAMIVDIVPASLEEIATKMPSPQLRG